MAIEINGNLRKHMVKVPEGAWEAKGIRLFSRKIRVIVFSTDIAIIRNTNAEAILAVYPFTPQPIITQAIVASSDMPVFAGVGGGITSGARSVSLAANAEQQGVIGVVFNAPIKNDVICSVAKVIDIPIVVTVVSQKDDIDGRIDAGVSILNVSAADQTPRVVEKIRQKHPNISIMATGGPTEESVRRTIEAGADAITWTPPVPSALLRVFMERYRHET